MSAIRLARAATGRDEAAEVRRRLPRPRRRPARRGRAGLATQGIPAQPGRARRGRRGDGHRALERPRGAVARDRARTSSRRSSPSPIPANMGLVPPAAGFLELLRERADAPTARCWSSTRSSRGFRVARGGAQELTGVSPDLTVMGKVIGGGLPAAAYGGSRELMERIAPAGDVYQAGTLSGNPLAVAAGLATLRCSTRTPTCAWRRPPSARRRPARGGRRPARSGRQRARAC